MDKEKLAKVGKGALIAGVGAAVVYLVDAIPSLGIPDAYLPIATAIGAVLVNAVRQLGK